MEGALLGRALAGEEAARESIYRQHAPDLYRFARELYGEEVAEDILQETFLCAFQRLGSFRGESSFRTWLLAVARSVAGSLLRKEARRERNGSNPRPPAASVNPEAAATSQEMVSAVRNALRKLSDEEREAVALYELQGLSSAEAAGLLGWSEARLRVTVWRARRRLREWLAPFAPSPSPDGRGQG